MPPAVTPATVADPRQMRITVATDHAPLLEPAPALTEPLKDLLYLDNVVFTTGIAEQGEEYVVASGEADLACRITHVPRSTFA